MKTKLLKRLRALSKENVKLWQDRATGEYVIHEKAYYLWEGIPEVKETFRTKDRKDAERVLVLFRRRYCLNQLGKKYIK